MTTVPRVGACFFGLLGLAFPKWVRAVAEGNSGTVSTVSESVDPFSDEVFGVEVMTKSGVSLESASTMDLGLNLRP